MSDLMEEWKCPNCPLTVWRYVTRESAKEKLAYFPHSIIHPDGDDPPCSSHHVQRTGRTRDGYLDPTKTPERYANDYPIFGRRHQGYQKPNSTLIERRRQEVLG